MINNIAERIRTYSLSIVSNDYVESIFIDDMLKNQDIASEMHTIAEVLWNGICLQLSGDDVPENLLDGCKASATGAYLHEVTKEKWNEEVEPDAFIRHAFYEFADKLEWCLASKFYIEDENYMYSSYISDVWWTICAAKCNERKDLHNEELIKWMAEKSAYDFIHCFQFDIDSLKQIAASWTIVPKDILSLNYDYRDDNLDAYIDRWANSSDEELRIDATHFYQTGAYCHIGDDLHMLLSLLLKNELYDEWLRIFYDIEYPELQSSMLYQVGSIEELLRVIQLIDITKLKNPKTAISIVERRWFDKIIDEGYNLYTYVEASEREGLTYRNLNQEIVKIGCDAYRRWEQNYPGHIEKGLCLLQGLDGDEALSKWLFSKQYRDDENVYKQAKMFNDVLSCAKNRFIEMADLSKLSIDANDITYLLFLGTLAIERGADEAYQKELFDSIIRYLFKEDNRLYLKLDTGGMEKMRGIRDLLVNLYKPDSDDLKILVIKHKTRYEGWNLLSEKHLYDQVKSESYLMCILLFAIENKDWFATDKIKSDYYEWLSQYVFDQIYHSTSPYFVQEYYRQVLVLMGLISNQIYTEKKDAFVSTCVDELDDVTILLDVLSSTDLVALGDNADMLKSRIKNEWETLKKQSRYKSVHAKPFVSKLDKYVKKYN